MSGRETRTIVRDSLRNARMIRPLSTSARFLTVLVLVSAGVGCSGNGETGTPVRAAVGVERHGGQASWQLRGLLRAAAVGCGATTSGNRAKWRKAPL